MLDITAGLAAQAFDAYDPNKVMLKARLMSNDTVPPTPIPIKPGNETIVV